MFLTPRYLTRTIMTALAVCALAACESSTAPQEPTDASVVGTYSAEGSRGTFRLVNPIPGVTLNLLSLGAHIEVILDAGGTARGELFIPGLDEDGGDVQEDLTGTWTRSGRTIRLSHNADTFLRDIDLTVQNDGSLVGEFGAEEGRVELRLVRN